MVGAHLRDDLDALLSPAWRSVRFSFEVAELLVELTLLHGELRSGW